MREGGGKSGILSTVCLGSDQSATRGQHANVIHIMRRTKMTKTVCFYRMKNNGWPPESVHFVPCKGPKIEFSWHYSDQGSYT